MTLEEKFEAVNSEFLEFDRIKNKRSNRPDLHAFLLLDELCPGTQDMINHAIYDEIYLSVLPENLSDEHILELVRCGVIAEPNGLKMFV